MRRALVLHPGALGDVLLAIPALRSLAAAAPDGELVLAAQPRIGRLLASLGVVDRCLDFDTLGLDALFADGPAPERLRSLLAGARVVSWFGSRDARFGDRLRSLALESVIAPTVPVEPRTVWEHLLDSVAPLTAVQEVRRDPVILGGERVDAGRRALLDAGWDGARPLVILHPGAGGAAKRWPVEGFAEVAQRVARATDADVVVHEGPADHDAVAALRTCVRVPVRVLADPPLETLAGAMHHASLVIGNDSGVTHLAAALGAATLALFIAANVAWRPWSRHARVRVVSAPALAPSDVDTVIGDALALLRSRDERASAARGDR
jgi:ADP-heptose:LPS heptosyltransferase